MTTCNKCNEELLTIWSYCPICGQSKFNTIDTIKVPQPTSPVVKEEPKPVPKPVALPVEPKLQAPLPKEIVVDRTIQISGNPNAGIKCGNCGSSYVTMVGGPSYMCTKCKYFGHIE